MNRSRPTCYRRHLLSLRHEPCFLPCGLRNAVAVLLLPWSAPSVWWACRFGDWLTCFSTSVMSDLDGFFSYLFLRRIRCCVNRRRGTSLWYRSLASPTEVTVFILRPFVWKHIAFHGDFYKSRNWASLTLSKSNCKLDCNAIERVWRTLTGIPVYELYYLFLLLLLLLFIFKVFVFF